MFQDSESDNTSASSELEKTSSVKASEEDVSSSSVAEASRATSLEDKEKVLDAVRKNVEQIKNDLGELLKDTWGKKIAEIERAKQTVEKERTRKVADISSGGV